MVKPCPLPLGSPSSEILVKLQPHYILIMQNKGTVKQVNIYKLNIQETRIERYRIIRLGSCAITRQIYANVALHCIAKLTTQ